jgi:dihydroorotate dehydrogenase electron transfer subunit
MNIGQVRAKIISNQKLSVGYGYLEFESALIAQQAKPGQFVNVRVIDAVEPLLRRPFSIHGVKASRVRIIYQILGKGTQILASRKPGEFLDIIGPLGNGFDYPLVSGKLKKTKPILVAGGMGVAPLVFLAEKLKSNPPLVLLGARTKEQLICLKEFKSLGCPVKVATDDGSGGFKGKVTDLLQSILPSASDPRTAIIYACGPHPMLKSVARCADENKISTQLSLEEHMACGVGACLGCAVLTKNGYKSVCKDGPVFSGQEIIW